MVGNRKCWGKTIFVRVAIISGWGPKARPKTSGGGPGAKPRKLGGLSISLLGEILMRNILAHNASSNIKIPKHF